METGRQSVFNFIRLTFYECHEVILVTWPLTQNSGHYQFRPWTDRRFQTTVGGVSSIPFAPIPSKNGRAGSGPPPPIPTGSSQWATRKKSPLYNREKGQTLSLPHS